MTPLAAAYQLESAHMVDLTQPLTSPLILTDGTVLQNLSDASRWLLTCDECAEVLAAAGHILNAANGGNVVAASNALKFAAFTMGRLEVMEATPKLRPRKTLRRSD